MSVTNFKSVSQGSPPTLTTSNSKRAHTAAAKYLPDGVSRCTLSGETPPIFIDRGSGSRIFDVDGNEYVDFANNFTTLIHGNAFPPIIRALEEQLQKGTCFNNPTVHEASLAKILCERVPSIDQIRFVNTGTEAVMTALKAARAITGRKKIAKLEGAYHGSYDWAEVSENSTPSNWGKDAPASVPSCVGTPTSVLDETVVLPFNDIDGSRGILEQIKGQLAGVLIDVAPSRAGLIPISPDYLQYLREFTEKDGAILISDEVLNFRQSFVGGACAYGVEADLVALGKIIGGGLPIGAVGGKAHFMSVFSRHDSEPPITQSGTFSANPLSMVGGIASMTAWTEDAISKINDLGEQIRHDIQEIIDRRSADFSVTGAGSLFRLHPKRQPPRNYREAYRNSDEIDRMHALNEQMRESGVFLASGGLGALSTVMNDEDITRFLEAFEKHIDSIV